MTIHNKSRENRDTENMPVVVAITGASGVVYGTTILDFLCEAGISVCLAISKSAQIALSVEMPGIYKKIKSKQVKIYHVDDISAPISSGSYLTRGMIVAPCTINTMSAIAHGITDNIITRAADVTLKEKRRLILMVRETPLHLGHLRTMVKLAEMGAIIMPPVPAYYQTPKTIQDLVDHTCGRALDLFGFHDMLERRWVGIP